MAIGFLIGWVRYWIGYYILIQGVIAGLILPWLVVKTNPNQKDALANSRFKIALLLFLSFMISQAIGFGFTQPVFDPFNWFLLTAIDLFFMFFFLLISMPLTSKKVKS